MLAAQPARRFSGQRNSPKRLSVRQAPEPQRTPSAVAQVLDTGQNGHRPGVGTATAGPDLASGALPTGPSGLSHPASHSRNYPAGLGKVSARGFVPTLFSAVGHGTFAAQSQNHAPNGPVELQKSAELGTGNPHALSSP